MLTVFGGLGGLTILMVYIGEGVRNAFDPRKTFLPSAVKAEAAAASNSEQVKS